MNTYITEINGEWYAFAGSVVNDQVYSIGLDRPPRGSGGDCYFASWSSRGIPHVASPSPNRKAAVSKARRHGEYKGVVIT